MAKGGGFLKNSPIFWCAPDGAPKKGGYDILKSRSPINLLKIFNIQFRPISVRAANISKTMAKKLARVRILDEETQSYITAAYLIAQLEKNYSLPKEQQIAGSVLLGFALETISNLKYSVGGVMEFLECENNQLISLLKAVLT